MKKLLKFIPMILIAIIGIAATSCSDDDKDQPMNPAQLPQQSKEFIAQYFPSITIASTTIDNNEFEVTLSNGIKIEFTKAGVWTSVEALPGQIIPNGYYPAPIDIYIGLNIDGAQINSISKETYGYEVGLVRGTELKFDAQGNLIGTQK